jgi:hypothetical protein
MLNLGTWLCEAAFASLVPMLAALRHGNERYTSTKSATFLPIQCNLPTKVPGHFQFKELNLKQSVGKIINTLGFHENHMGCCTFFLSFFFFSFFFSNYKSKEAPLPSIEAT